MSKDNKKHADLLERIDADFEQSQDNQTESYDDRRFVFIAGAQWDGAVGQQFANRPKFEFNKILLSLIRIYNDWAKNRFTMQFRADSYPADADTAEALNALIRGDERDSDAEEAYSNAFMEGISGGIGAFQILAEYENESDEDDDKQRIRVKPIFEADTCVYWDANAKRYDKSDANHVTVVVSMGKSDYERKYNKSADDVTNFDDLDGLRFDWQDNDHIKVAEHYEVTERKRKVLKLKHEHEDQPITLYQDDENFDADLKLKLDSGYTVIFEKTVKERIVKGYVLDGSGIIEKMGQIAGNYLPIVPYYGKRMYISGREITQGHVRLARDAQIAYNIKMSGLIDLSSRPQDELPIFTPEQINGHSAIWAGKEIDKPAYLTINPILDGNGGVQVIGPQAYTKAPQIPQALAAIIEKADNDIHELTGNQANGEQLVSNVSTEAVELVQDKVDSQSYVFIDNWAKTMRHAGKVWLSIAQAVYDEEMREMVGMTHDDQDKPIIINEPTIKNGEMAYKNDMQKGKYRIAVDIGEAFATQRDKTLKRLFNLIPLIQDPTTQSVLTNTILANQDGEGMKDLNKFARKNLITAGVIEPNEEEQQEMAQAQQAAQGQPPDAQTTWLQAEAQKAMAIAEKQKADTAKTLAEVDETRAGTAKTLLDVQQQQLQMHTDIASIMQILQSMQQSQVMQGEQIKSELGGQAGGQGGEIPPEVLAQMQDLPQMPQSLQQPTGNQMPS